MEGKIHTYTFGRAAVSSFKSVFFPFIFFFQLRCAPVFFPFGEVRFENCFPLPAGKYDVVASEKFRTPNQNLSQSKFVPRRKLFCTLPVFFALLNGIFPAAKRHSSTTTLSATMDNSDDNNNNNKTKNKTKNTNTNTNNNKQQTTNEIKTNKNKQQATNNKQQATTNNK